MEKRDMTAVGNGYNWKTLRNVVAGLRPAVEPGILPGGISARRHKLAKPTLAQALREAGRPHSTAGETLAATRFMEGLLDREIAHWDQ